MSYSQECHGQRRMRPSWPYWNSYTAPGTVVPTTRPRHTRAAWCGHEFFNAKNSPSRLNTPTSRPSRRTILRPPGGISSTFATTCLAKARTVHGERVVDHHALPHRVRNVADHVPRIAQVPVRIAARKQQRSIGLDHVQHLVQV